MQAIILAAGEGRRLHPLTANRPKVMIPVAGLPLIEHAVQGLVESGIKDITIVTGYHKEKVQTHFQDGHDWGANISYAVQERQLGTGHALATALDMMAPDGPFLVLPGDNHVTPRLIQELVAARGESAIVTTRATEPGKYGVVQLDGDNVSRIDEKPSAPESRLISTGIYRLLPSIRPFLDGPEGVVLTNALNAFVAKGNEVRSLPLEDAWHDIVYPWDLLRVNHHVLAEMKDPVNHGETDEGVTLGGAVHVGHGTTLRQGTYIIGPVHIGNHCDIGPNVVIRGPASIGNHVRIGPFSDLEDVAIMDDVQIDTGAILRHTIVDEGARLGPRVASDSGPAVFEIENEFRRINQLGAVIGEDAFIGANVVLEPGSVIGRAASIAPNRTVHRVPDHGVVA